MSADRRKKVLVLIVFCVLLLLSGSLYYIFSAIQYYYAVAIAWIISVIILLWYGNQSIFNFLDRRLPWLSRTSTRFLAQLLLSLVYSLACINLTYYVFKLQTSSAPDVSQMLVLNVYGLLFIIPVLSVNFSIYFVMQWKLADKQSDLLREENLRTQLNSLRMQLDPHFLFNNLNVLSSLIETSQETAKHFLDKFADVYRYVLQYKQEELVPLAVELEFVEAYAYLLKQRFGSQLMIDIDIPEGYAERFFLPPLALQLLLENALKHNSIAGAEAFIIDVSADDQTLKVRNTLRPMAASGRSTGGTGLNSIRRRYDYLSDRNLEIHKTESFFIVSLPLLEID